MPINCVNPLCSWCSLSSSGSWTPPRDQKPEWLKQWTISKGWMHNKSHLLDLTVPKTTAEPQYDREPLLLDKKDDYRRTFPKTTLFQLVREQDDDRLVNQTIFECSEDEISVFENPIYATSVAFRRSSDDVVDSSDLAFTNQVDFSRSSIDQIQKSRVLDMDNFKSFTHKLKTEKLVIRHIRLRVMLSLHLGRLVNIYSYKRRKKRRKRDRTLVKRIRNIHEEQKMIGNGHESLKIQNLRFGRLNVLRWLLWEAEVRKRKMPALERHHGGPSSGAGGSGSGSTTLALHYAAARGCLDCVRLLVDSSPDLRYSVANTQMDNDVTPVYLAAQEGHLEVLKFLVLEAGGSLYVRAKDGMAPIHAASQMGCLNCVKWMIQDQGVDPNLRDGDGATPLHFAASRGHLDTVRWLLKHGARLSLDKYGKSPINDAAENQQVECLNVLVQHGTTPDYNKDSEKKYSCSCARKESKRSASDCSTCKRNNHQEPFYLHPPLSRQPVETPHAPQDGLYINPMGNHLRHTSNGSDSSGSTNGESFYLHNPQEVIYNRVKDLFPSNNPLSGLTVKVEVHSSSSGAGSDENSSSSDLSDRSGDHDHDYEDIYMVREDSKNPRSRSRDSGSHSRSASNSSSASTGCNVIVKLTTNNNSNSSCSSSTHNNNHNNNHSNNHISNNHNINKESGLSSSSPSTLSEEESEKVHKALGKSISVPPPPPPPLPMVQGSLKSLTLNPSKQDSKEAMKSQMRNQRTDGLYYGPTGEVEEEEVARGAEEVEIVEEPTVRPSDVVKGMCRSMTALSAKRLNSSCSDLTIVSLESADDTHHSSSGKPLLLAGKTRVLPFVPPSFPANSNNHLIKPSEYLKTIGKNEGLEVATAIVAPPPPPLPDVAAIPLPPRPPPVEISQAAKKQQQPLSAISIHDINSVQLRRTEKMPASKTFSAPTRSVSLQSLQPGSDCFVAQKIDLIAELKMSKDITGIKKLKIERAKVELNHEKEMFTEISKQFSSNHFVEMIPDKDNTGNAIPAWKRQMLAKKAAEKARKELEEQMLREAEEKRLQAIPQWKRQLLAKKEEAENKLRQTLYTPKVEENNKFNFKSQQDLSEFRATQEVDSNNNNEPSNDCAASEISSTTGKDDEDDSNSEDEVNNNIIPWRAQLRKTNSKLNLLD